MIAALRDRPEESTRRPVANSGVLSVKNSPSETKPEFIQLSEKASEILPLRTFAPARQNSGYILEDDIPRACPTRCLDELADSADVLVHEPGFVSKESQSIPGNAEILTG